jgi:hypothetical protein
MVRKYISLHVNSKSFEIIQRARLTAARADQEQRTRNAAKLAGVRALVAVRRAFDLDEKTNFRFLPESKREQLRKWRKMIEQDLRRIAGDNP